MRIPAWFPRRFDRLDVLCVCFLTVFVVFGVAADHWDSTFLGTVAWLAGGAPFGVVAGDIVRRRAGRCETCGRRMTKVGDGLDLDCGGDCWGCISAVEEDPAVVARVHRAIEQGRRGEGRPWREVFSELDWPNGLRCGACNRPIREGETIHESLEAFQDDVPVLDLVCAKCAAGDGVVDW